MPDDLPILNSSPVSVPVAEEFLCVRCARQRKTCCQVSEIFVTRGDIDRVAQATGQNDFHEFRAPDNPDYGDQDDDPTWRDRAFRPDGTRRVLRRRADGDCVFLGPQGCVMSYTSRPLVCRLYPFEYTEQGLASELSTGCPTELLRPGQGLIDALAMDPTVAEQWRAQLYQEIHHDYAAEAPPAPAETPCSSV